MTCAPASASRELQNGAATAFDGDDGQSFQRQHLVFSVGTGHAQHILGEVG
jgi:hypothetical protein